VEGEDAYAFLGVDVKPRENGGYTMTQEGLIKKVLKATGMEDCNRKATPAASVPLGSDENGKPYHEEWNYASIVGMLLYLSSNSRPDIQFAVHQCARFTHAPKQSHADAIKRICRYLQATSTKGLEFIPSQAMELDCYVDTDFAVLWNYDDDQDPVCVKSQTGYVITLGGCPVIWVSKLHSTIFEDNNGALSLATAPKLTPCMKHIGVKYHWFKSLIGKEQGFDIVKVESKEQKADIFTKGLPAELFQHVRGILMGW